MGTLTICAIWQKKSSIEQPRQPYSLGRHSIDYSHYHLGSVKSCNSRSTSILLTSDMVDSTSRDFGIAPAYIDKVSPLLIIFHCHTNVNMSHRQLYQIFNLLNYLSGVF